MGLLFPYQKCKIYKENSSKIHEIEKWKYTSYLAGESLIWQQCPGTATVEDRSSDLGQIDLFKNMDPHLYLFATAGSESS